MMNVVVREDTTKYTYLSGFIYLRFLFLIIFGQRASGRRHCQYQVASGILIFMFMSASYHPLSFVS